MAAIYVKGVSVIKFISNIFSAFFSPSNMATEALVEFSTSMDFEEFEIILKKLANIDSEFENDISIIVKNFQESSNVGESKKVNLETVPGYAVLEKEDDNAFSIAIFTLEKSNVKIEKAYDLGTTELDRKSVV